MVGKNTDYKSTKSQDQQLSGSPQSEGVDREDNSKKPEINHMIDQKTFYTDGLKLSPKLITIYWKSPQLILVTTATTGGGVILLRQCTF